jgi:hypothetical protein
VLTNDSSSHGQNTKIEEKIHLNVFVGGGASGVRGVDEVTEIRKP